jgi:chromosome partitioning protein
MEAQLPLFVGGIRRLNVFQRAALEGCLVQDVADRYGNVAWECYKAVGQEVLP